jgi:hypothetical protein
LFALAADFKFYVNGLLEGTDAGAYVASSSNVWIGHEGGYGGSTAALAQFTGSYAYLFSRALLGSDLLAIFDAARCPDGDRKDDQVW